MCSASDLTLMEKAIVKLHGSIEFACKLNSHSICKFTKPQESNLTWARWFFFPSATVGVADQSQGNSVFGGGNSAEARKTDKPKMATPVDATMKYLNIYINIFKYTLFPHIYIPKMLSVTQCHDAICSNHRASRSQLLKTRLIPMKTSTSLAVIGQNKGLVGMHKLLQCPVSSKYCTEFGAIPDWHCGEALFFFFCMLHSHWLIHVSVWLCLCSNASELF